jgi:putative transposase
MKYYSNLKELIKVSGSQSLVFVDESGFDSFQDCAYGWSKKGKKILGEKSGKRGKEKI